MNQKLKITGIGALALTAIGCVDQPKDQRPNIIFVLADDIGAEAFGCYGGVSYETPNIDELARQGVLYSNMHSMPLSCPSRVQAMTGVYNDRNYVNFGYINDDEHTFAQLAQTAGYSTAMVGKWQLGRSREIPGKLGFDEWCLNQLEMYKEFAPGTMGKYTDRYANSYIDNNGRYDLSLYGPDAFQNYCYDFIDRMVASGKPFLLYYNTPLVHTPHTPTPDSESWDLDYAGRFIGDAKNFPDMVAYLDKQVGQLVNHLKTVGIWDNTILIFTADNGTSTRIVSELADGTKVRGGKGTPLHTGTHVPLIITWGDKIEKGRVCNCLVDLTDFMPTFADAMQVQIPAEWYPDGVSLYPELVGDTPLEKKLILCHFNPLWPTTPSPLASRFAQTADYKYYWDGRFYNVSNDLNEENPLDVSHLSEEVQTVYTMLKTKVDEFPDFYPDKPGAPRRGNYGTFYDFADPQNPF